MGSFRFGRPEFAPASGAGYCKYCRNQLTKVPVSAATVNSPFNKSEPAVLCETCDGPGQLPPAEVTEHA